MGMIAYFTAANITQLNALREHPESVEDFLFPNDGDDEPENTIDIDKAWHGIHFLLNKLADNEESPFNQTVFGGEAVGEDLGYGPARLMGPDLLKEVATLIASVTPETLEAAYDPKAMTAEDIYPGFWERDGREAFDYLMHYFTALSEFYQAAAERGDGAVLWMA